MRHYTAAIIIDPLNLDTPIVDDFGPRHHKRPLVLPRIALRFLHYLQSGVGPMVGLIYVLISLTKVI